MAHICSSITVCTHSSSLPVHSAAFLLFLFVVCSFSAFSTKKLFQLERIYLDGQSLSSIDDCFDLMSHSLTHIYLQRNALTSTQGFSSLRQLRFLTLAHNRIRSIEGLAGLASLQFLDVSHNLIELLDTGDADSDEDTCQLPESLVVFNCAGNPFTAEGDEYKEHVATVSPYLKSMDGERITNRMRRGWGLEADEDDAEDDAAIAAATAAAAAAAAAARARAAQKGDGDEDEVEELSKFSPHASTLDHRILSRHHIVNGPPYVLFDRSILVVICAVFLLSSGESDEDADGDDAADIAAYALRAEAEEMRKRSEQRTMLYDTTHGVSPATTQQDRQDALAEAARAAGGKQ